MSDISDDSFALSPPAFKPDDALAQIKRALRDLKLAERGSGFELRGKRVVELAVEGEAITARLTRKLALTPHWDTQTVKSTGEQRKLVDEVKRRLARWEHED